MTIAQLQRSDELGHKMDSSFQSISTEISGLESGVLDLIHTELRSLRNARAFDSALGTLHQDTSAQSTQRPSTDRCSSQQSTSQLPNVASLEIQPSAKRDAVYAVTWRSMRYSFPVGCLQVDRATSAVHSIDNIRARPLSRAETERRWRFTFLSPEWLSKHIVQVELAQIGALMPAISIGPRPCLGQVGPPISAYEDLQMLPLQTQFRLMALNQETDHAFVVREKIALL